MKKILFGTLLLLLMACESTQQETVEPVAKVSIEKTSFNVMEPVYVTNIGSGEYFSFWPGDEGQDYAMKDSARNTGLSPNVGQDFEYSYLRSGTYTMTCIAASYDEISGEYTYDKEEIEITINPGEDGNNFTSFSIENAYKGYSPAGIINGDSITIPIGYFNRAFNIEDGLFAQLINSRPPLFSVSSSTAAVYSEDGDVLKGRGNKSDAYELNVLNETTLEPIVRTFRVVQDGASRDYKVAALFYPEISNLKVNGRSTIKYSYNGLSSISDDEIKQQQLTKLDESFYGLLVIGSSESLKKSKLTFTLEDGARLYHHDSGMEIESGVTELDLSGNSPISFTIYKEVKGFVVESTVKLYISVF
jgi:hypothetical protein